MIRGLTVGDDFDLADYFTWLDDGSWIRVSARVRVIIFFDRAPCVPISR